MTLGNDDGLADKVQVVLNRVGSDDGDISLKKAEETIGKPIYWQVPNDSKPMLESRNAGVPLLQHAPEEQGAAEPRRPGRGAVRQGSRDRPPRRSRAAGLLLVPLMTRSAAAAESMRVDRCRLANSDTRLHELRTS